jgi:transcriptional regulator with XRE-family HTH domain
MKTDERRQARELRAKGCSVREIERRLGLARSSVSLWVRDVELTAEQRAALMARMRTSQAAARERKAAAARAVRKTYQDEGRVMARERDGSYAAGCMLYWAEGDKQRNSVRLSNADPEVLVFFADFLREHFGVRDEQMSVYCNLFADHVARQNEIERYWLERLELPSSCLRKSIVNVYSKYTSKKRSNKLPYGTCKLAVHSTCIVQTIFGSIQEYGGFERPAWLD